MVWWHGKTVEAAAAEQPGASSSGEAAFPFPAFVRSVSNEN